MERLTEKSAIINEYRLKDTSVEGCQKAINKLAEYEDLEDDDACEWYADNKGNYKCKAHAETYDSRVLDWNLCPYCRKKIKIVE